MHACGDLQLSGTNTSNIMTPLACSLHNSEVLNAPTAGCGFWEHVGADCSNDDATIIAEVEIKGSRRRRFCQLRVPFSRVD